MKSAIAELVSSSPYSQGRHYDTVDVPKLPKELPDAYDSRTWRHRMHATPEGYVEIPGSAFANAIKKSAQRLAIKIPGKGMATYTKAFDTIMVPDGVRLPVKVEDVPGERLFVPADGRPGGGKRVTRTFPRIDSWRGTVTFYVFDDLLTEDVFRTVLVSTGLLIGIGRFRPENRGFYGRFTVASLRWVGSEETQALLGGAAA